MAYPTGTGSECLYRGAIDGQADDVTAFRWDRTDPTKGTDTYTVPALHIITLLSVTICDQANAAGVIQMYCKETAGNAIWLLEDQAIGMDGTFIWNEKIVLIGGDQILVQGGSGDSFDIWYSFIDQNWEN